MSCFKISKNSFYLLIPIFLIIFIMLLAGYGESQTGESQNTEGLKARILIFSGRPDPEFLLKEKDLIDKVRELLNLAVVNEKIKEGTVIPSRLGYSGILLRNPGKITGLPDCISIYGRNIEVKTKDKEIKFLQDNGALENLILSKAIEMEVIDIKLIRMKGKDIR